MAITPAAAAIKPGSLPKNAVKKPVIADDHIPTNGDTPTTVAYATDVGIVASAVTTPAKLSRATMDAFEDWLELNAGGFPILKAADETHCNCNRLDESPLVLLLPPSDAYDLVIAILPKACTFPRQNMANTKLTKILLIFLSETIVNVYYCVLLYINFNDFGIFDTAGDE